MLNLMAILQLSVCLSATVVELCGPILPRNAQSIAKKALTATTYQAVEDTFVVDWSGSSPLIRRHDQERELVTSKGDVVPRRYVTYVKFALAPLGGRARVAKRATLRLKTVDPCDPHAIEREAAYGVHVVIEEWSAPRLDDSYLPSYEGSVDWQYPQRLLEGSWIEWDVTVALRDQLEEVAQNGFAIDVDDNRIGHSYCVFQSSETSNPPELLIEPEVALYMPALLATVR